MAQVINYDRVDQFVRAVFNYLIKTGGSGKPKDILAGIYDPLQLTDYEKQRTKSGAVRWETTIRFYVIDCVKAGLMTRTDGIWSITEKGKEALRLPPGQLIREAKRGYDEWNRNRQDNDALLEEPLPNSTEVEIAERQAVYEQARESARQEIEDHINALQAYDFQKLVAELLKAMGYHISKIAQPGPDGGIDIEAYKDPLGTITPRIRVQVKHRDHKATAKEIRELQGLLRKDGDIGLFVSSSGFTSEADRELRASSIHIETMDLDRLINLWQQHYEHVSESGKALLPLVRLYFLAPTEE